MEDVEQVAVDGTVFLNGTGEGDIDNLVVVDADHDVAKPFLDGLDRGSPIRLAMMRS